MKQTSTVDKKTICNVLITGGTGLVGSALTRSLQQRGYNLILLARKPLTDHKADSLNIKPEAFLQGDVSKAQLGLSNAAYRDLAHNTDTIFHLAARVDFKGRCLDDYQDINVGGTRNISQFARDSGASLHYASTAFVSGTSNTFNEEQFDVGQRFRNGYEESKFLAEKEIRKFMTELPGRANIYRLAIILEREANPSNNSAFGPFFFMDAVFRMLLAGGKHPRQEPLRLLGDPKGHLPLLFADQTAEALVDLAEMKKFDKTFHLVPRTPLDNNTLAELFNQAFGRQVVTWASNEEFNRKPADRAEKILRKKTAVYADYLALQIKYGRKNLESALGPSTLPCPSNDELLQAFSDFLASRKPSKQISMAHHKLVADYFEIFLPQFYGRQLLENLVSLNVIFWIEIDAKNTWSIQIKQGCLEAVTGGNPLGDFGYRVDSENFLKVIQCQISPQEGFFRGAIKLAGNNIEALRTATALEEFFSQFTYNPATTASVAIT